MPFRHALECVYRTMRIEICDQNESSRAALKELLFCYARENGISADIVCCGCGCLSTEDCSDIIFLDAQNPCMSGIGGLQQRQRLSAIVLTSDDGQDAVRAFHGPAVHYLVRPYDAQQVSEAMDRCLMSLRMRIPACLKVHVHREDLPIPMASIQFIDVFNKITVIHTVRHEYETYTTLSEIDRCLDHSIFLRIHRSAIVNMNEISVFTSQWVRLRNGKMFPLSRDRKEQLAETYQEFLIDRATETAEN